MSEKQLTEQEINFIKSQFAAIRSELDEYCKDRDFILTNAQLFTFLTFTPNTIAIAGDGKVDDTEILALFNLSRTISVEGMISSPELDTTLKIPEEPENCISNPEFNMRVGSELLYLSRNMPKYEQNLITALKILLSFDTNPKAEGSMTDSFLKMMDSIVDNNVSENKDEEQKKLDMVKQQLDIA